MPRIFGLVPSDSDLPYAEQCYVVSLLTSVPNNSNVTLTLGTYTMPFPGDLFATFTVDYTFPANTYQQASPRLDASTPTPNSAPTLNHIGGSGAEIMRGALPMYAYWSSLAQGTIVTIKMVFFSGGGGTAVGIDRAAGSVRAVRLGL